MKERPIIFSSKMVKAILEGRKSMTRRILKLQPTIKPEISMNTKYGIIAIWPGESEFDYYDCHCPYGQPGDRLWVRETWRIIAKPNAYEDAIYGIQYKADGIVAFPDIPLFYHFKCLEDNHTWHPSIFMLRWASRITLKITNIRVERLQEITDEDCVFEGISHDTTIITVHEFEELNTMTTTRFAFKYLWNSIYKKNQPWESNPWVWVIEFEKETEDESKRTD